MTNSIENTKYAIASTKMFQKQLKKIYKQGKKIDKLIFVVEKLANGEKLDHKYKDHALIDNKYFQNCRECHIEPDWLLVYKYSDTELILFLVETGSHSEVLGI